MREIEILVEVFSSAKDALQVLEQFEFLGKKHTLDIYYFDPLRDKLKLDEESKLMESCRLRSKNNNAFLTYKVDHYEQKNWLYSDEYEVKISDFETGKSILNNLGLVPLIILNNDKHTFKHNNFEIVFEIVEGLGTFLEVELLSENENTDVQDEKKAISSFIDSLGLNISEELNAGKPELLLNKQIEAKRNIQR